MIKQQNTGILRLPMCPLIENKMRLCSYFSNFKSCIICTYLIQAFAKRKINDSDGWLEIRPKEITRKNKAYDINDHNELKRLIENLLNGLFGTGLWTKEKHFKPLKESLFELSPMRERKIRLRIPKEQIFIQKP